MLSGIVDRVRTIPLRYSLATVVISALLLLATIYFDVTVIVHSQGFISLDIQCPWPHLRDFAFDTAEMRGLLIDPSSWNV